MAQARLGNCIRPRLESHKPNPNLNRARALALALMLKLTLIGTCIPPGLASWREGPPPAGSFRLAARLS